MQHRQAHHLILLLGASMLLLAAPAIGGGTTDVTTEFFEGSSEVLSGNIGKKFKFRFALTEPANTSEIPLELQNVKKKDKYVYYEISHGRFLVISKKKYKRVVRKQAVGVHCHITGELKELRYSRESRSGRRYSTNGFFIDCNDIDLVYDFDPLSKLSQFNVARYSLVSPITLDLSTENEKRVFFSVIFNSWGTVGESEANAVGLDANEWKILVPDVTTQMPRLYVPSVLFDHANIAKEQERLYLYGRFVKTNYLGEECPAVILDYLNKTYLTSNEHQPPQAVDISAIRISPQKYVGKRIELTTVYRGSSLLPEEQCADFPSLVNIPSRQLLDTADDLGASTQLLLPNTQKTETDLTQVEAGDTVILTGIMLQGAKNRFSFEIESLRLPDILTAIGKDSP